MVRDYEILVAEVIESQYGFSANTEEDAIGLAGSFDPFQPVPAFGSLIAGPIQRQIWAHKIIDRSNGYQVPLESKMAVDPVFSSFQYQTPSDGKQHFLLTIRSWRFTPYRYTGEIPELIQSLAGTNPFSGTLGNGLVQFGPSVPVQTRIAALTHSDGSELQTYFNIIVSNLV